MEMNIGSLISIISIVIAISSFAISRKDKSNKDVESTAYRTGKLEEKVDNISKQLEKVLEKLDNYSDEIDIRVDKAIKQHCQAYHINKGV